MLRLMNYLLLLFQGDSAMEVILQSPNSQRKRDGSPPTCDTPVKRSKSVEEAQVLVSTVTHVVE